MKWRDIRVNLNGFPVTITPISYSTAVPEDGLVTGELLDVSAMEPEELQALRASLSQARGELLTSALFYPRTLPEPMEWLVQWCQKHDLKLISEDPLVFDDKWFVHFSGNFPKANVPDAIVPVTLRSFH